MQELDDNAEKKPKQGRLTENNLKKLEALYRKKLLKTPHFLSTGRIFCHFFRPFFDDFFPKKIVSISQHIAPKMAPTC